MTKAKLTTVTMPARTYVTPGKPATVTISIVELETLRAKAEVCDSYTRTLVLCDPLARRRLQDALHALSLLRTYH